MTNKDHLQKLISEKTLRLQLLEQQKARKGDGTPPETILEIKDLQTEIAALQAELVRLESGEVSDSSSLPPSPHTVVTPTYIMPWYRQATIPWLILGAITLLIVLMLFGALPIPPWLLTSSESANSQGPSLDHILKPILFYSFEAISTVPNNIKGDDNTPNIELAQEPSLSSDHSVLKLTLDLTPYDSSTEKGYGGFYVDLGGIERVDAMSISVFVPKQSNTESGDFAIQFVAVTEKDEPVYSGSSPISIDRWTPLFWRTKYAYNGPRLCEDDNRDAKCDDDKPGIIWWHAWRDTYIKGFHFRILRYNENYQGPVYVDNLAAYKLNVEDR